jgi:hypothetical protein
MKILNSAAYTLCLLTAFVWFPSNTQASTQGLTQEEIDAQVQQNLNTPIACGCSLQDDIDIENRIAMVNMIGSEFGAAKKKYAGSKQTVTPEIRDAVQQPIQQRINNEQDPKARDYSANTGDFFCTTSFQSGVTPCLRGALDDHEAVHRAACEANPGTDWRYKQLVEDWIQEEMDAYKKEGDRLREERSKRLPFCKLDPSVKKILWQLAADKEREKEAKEIVDWFLGIFN